MASPGTSSVGLSDRFQGVVSGSEEVRYEVIVQPGEFLKMAHPGREKAFEKGNFAHVDRSAVILEPFVDKQADFNQLLIQTLPPAAESRKSLLYVTASG